MIEHIEGKLAVITGAGDGIGRAVAISLASQGMHLALLDINEEGLINTVALLATDGVAATYVVDVTNQENVNAVATQILSEFGVPAVLVNCAGKLGPFLKHIWEYSNEEWHSIFEVNVFGNINTVREFLPAMRELNEPSHVVSIASTAGLYASPRGGLYAASKHALVSYIETLWSELQAEESPVGVSMICPGAVLTNFNLEVRTFAGEVDTSGPDWIGPEDVAVKVVESLSTGDLYVYTHDDTRAHFEDYQRKVNATLT